MSKHRSQHRSRSSSPSRSRSPPPARSAKHKKSGKRHKTSQPAPEVPRKRSHNESDSTSDESDSERPSNQQRSLNDAKTLTLYRLAGRGIGRIRDPFLDIKQLFMFYAALANANTPESRAALADNIYGKLKDKHAKHAYMTCYEKIVGMVKGFRDIVDGGEQNAALVNELLEALSSGMYAAQCDDRSYLKTEISDYISIPLQEPIQKHSKMGRGLNHIDITRLLCPVRYLRKFDSDPEGYRQKFIQGQKKIRGNMYAAFAYERYEFDRRNPEAGLFRSAVLIKTMRHIFTGPTSAHAFEDGGGTRSTNAELIGIGSVTGRMIAYAYIQVRYALSSKSKWSTKDGKFDYMVAYNKVVAQFETHPEDPWVLETLAWYNKQVFGSESGRIPDGKETDSDVDDESDDDDDDALDQQARRAAAGQSDDEDEDQPDTRRRGKGPYANRYAAASEDEEMAVRQPGAHDVEYEDEQMMDHWQQWPQGLPVDDAEYDAQKQGTDSEDEGGDRGGPPRIRRSSPRAVTVPSSPLTQPSSSPPPSTHSDRAVPAAKKRRLAVAPGPQLTARSAAVAQGNASAKATVPRPPQTVRDLFNSPEPEPVNSTSAGVSSKKPVKQYGKAKAKAPQAPVAERRTTRQSARAK